MKKLMIPCLAATLLLGSTVVAGEAGATNSSKADASIKVAHNTEGKKRGLENALQNGNKSPAARAAIERNIEKQKAHQKWKEEKQEQKHKDKDKKKDKKDEKVDLTLSTFTIGGVDVSNLAGLSTQEGAVLKVADFNDFQGIKVEGKSDQAEVTVTLNGSKIYTDYLKNIQLRNQDVIVVQVKDGQQTKEYKVTLEKADSIALSKFTIGGVDVRSLSGLASKEGATLRVTNFDNFSGIVAQAEDNKAEVTVTLNGNKVNKDLLATLLLRADDQIVVTVKKGETEENYKVTLVKADSTALSKFTIGGVDVGSLPGLTSKEGATLKVDGNSNFKGIAAEAANKDAEVTVYINGEKVSKDGLAGLLLRIYDVITVKVAEDKQTETYKVTLRSE